MAGGCKSAIGCVDARAPVRASYVSLYKWPESDAEFVKSVAMARRQSGQDSPAAGGPGAGAASAPSYYHRHHHHHYYYNGGGSKRSSGELGAAAGHGSPRVVDSYSCRQMYLRSYTFSKKKETVPEHTIACLGRVRERAAVFPFLPQRGGAGGGSSTAASDAGSVGSASAGVVGRSESRDRDGVGLRDRKAARRRSRSRRKKKKKRCAMVRRLQEASCGAVRAIFRRLLACTTSVDVADAGAPPSSR